MVPQVPLVAEVPQVSLALKVPWSANQQFLNTSCLSENENLSHIKGVHCILYPNKIDFLNDLCRQKG